MYLNYSRNRFTPTENNISFRLIIPWALQTSCSDANASLRNCRSNRLLFWLPWTEVKFKCPVFHTDGADHDGHVSIWEEEKTAAFHKSKLQFTRKGHLQKLNKHLNAISSQTSVFFTQIKMYRIGVNDDIWRQNSSEPCRCSQSISNSVGIPPAGSWQSSPEMSNQNIWVTLRRRRMRTATPSPLS